MSNSNTPQPFSLPQMLARARAETGLDDFGEAEHLEALRRLVESTRADMVLTEAGTIGFREDVHRLLVNRLRFAADLKRHPEILDEDVCDPIIVIGLPRTGTTKLQRMLSADPAMQRLDYWRLLNPAPFPGAATGQRDPRIEVARQFVGMMRQAAPGFLAGHPFFADQPDEDTFLQLLTFKSILTFLLHPAAGYFDWLSSQPRDGTYRYVKRLLQYLQWQDGGKRDRPFVMKSPTHVGNLDLLRELYPRATIVFTHRALHQAIPSFCKLIEMGWQLKTERRDSFATGQLALALWSNEMRRHYAQRRILGARADVFDVGFEQLRDEPMTVIDAIYRRAGRELTAETVVAMRTWERDNPPGHYGAFHYRLEDYGLSHESIDAAFGDITQPPLD